MSSSRTDVALVDMVLPAMGTSVVEGTIVAWSKAVGDHVAVDETVCEVSTDKIDTECPSPVAGVVAEHCVEVGDTVEVGTVIARIAPDGGAAPARDDSASAPAAKVPAASSPVAAHAGAQAPSPGANGSPRRYSPVVARIAADRDVDLSRVTGTGRNGRVTKRDLLAYLEAEPEERPLHSESPYRPDEPPAAAPAAAAAAPPGPGRAEPLSRMRQSIGRAMLDSQRTAATCHTVVECDFTGLDALRRQLGITALPLVARATVETLRAFPDLNATLDGEIITRYDTVNLGIAVSLGDDGLIVPVIRDAQELSPEGLARAIKDLAGRARAKTLTPDDVQGATFTITNPGAFGAIIATPVIDLPRVAILDLEAVVRRPVVVTDAAGQESIAIRSMVNLILGWDHRAMDGVYAARFLTALRGRLEALVPA